MISKAFSFAQTGTPSSLPVILVAHTNETGKKATEAGWKILSRGGSVLDAAEKAARFLVSMQAKDGSWHTGNSSFANQLSPAYNSRVGWALIVHGKNTGSNLDVEAGERNIEYTISRQHENGWFEDNWLSEPKAPLLHTICYAVEGLLGAHNELGKEHYLARALLTIEHLIDCIRPDGGIPGCFDSQWRGTVRWSCLTGSAQLSAILLSLFANTRDTRHRIAAERILAFLKSTQNCVANDLGLRGGIKGSYPFDGAYGRYEVLNWATKFYVDALLLDEKLS